MSMRDLGLRGIEDEHFRAIRKYLLGKIIETFLNFLYQWITWRMIWLLNLNKGVLLSTLSWSPSVSWWTIWLPCVSTFLPSSSTSSTLPSNRPDGRYCCQACQRRNQERHPSCWRSGSPYSFEPQVILVYLHVHLDGGFKSPQFWTGCF